MQFKIKNTVYKISFSFLALILFVLTVSENKSIVLWLIFALLHEIVHLVFIFLFSVAPESVSLSILGADIKRGVITSLNPNAEIIINASAPVFNIFTGAFFYLLSDCFADNNQFLQEISKINFTLGCFNLIPFHTFDGGNVLKYVLLKIFTTKITEQILTCVSLVITVGFSFVSIHIFLSYQNNFSLIIICVYMFISIIFKKQNYLDY